jgi:hypothetical protein
MSHSPTEIAGRDLSGSEPFQQVVAGCRPVVIRGLVDDWPVVRAARDQHGLLGPLQPDNYGKIRARVMHLLRGS